jgi:anti-sigma regulatory factor (Ser/Thr protein kinase)
LDLRFEADGLYALRSSVAAHAAHLGASPQAIERLLIVASELSTNAVRHGGGRGRLRLWASNGQVHCEVSDAGAGLADVMAGTERPNPTAPGGRGLWISRQLGHDFSIETGTKGTTVRVAIALAFDGDGDGDSDDDDDADGDGDGDLAPERSDGRFAPPHIE